MIAQHLPIEAMLPRISLSRFFETEKEPGQVSPESHDGKRYDKYERQRI